MGTPMDPRQRYTCWIPDNDIPAGRPTTIHLLDRRQPYTCRIPENGREGKAGQPGRPVRLAGLPFHPFPSLPFPSVARDPAGVSLSGIQQVYRCRRSIRCIVVGDPSGESLSGIHLCQQRSRPLAQCSRPLAQCSRPLLFPSHPFPSFPSLPFPSLPAAGAPAGDHYFRVSGLGFFIFLI